jgi:hypothetical protein
MPRAYWKGYLRLSLVTCPIELFPATSQAEKTHFHQINTQTGHRLRQQMVDEETGRVVDAGHKGRGYELTKGKYVEIDEDELKAIQVESTHTVEIDGFVPRADIDKRYLDKPYYIAPNGKTGAEAFVVIRDAMQDARHLEVLRRGLPLVCNLFVLDLLTLVQGRQTGPLYRRNVDENVLAAALRLNEPITFGRTCSAGTAVQATPTRMQQKKSLAIIGLKPAHT